MLSRPHTITRWSITQVESPTTRVANGVRYDEPTDFKVQVTPMSQRATIDRLGYDLDQPYLVIGHIDDADGFKIGDLISYDGFLHKIIAHPEKFNAANAAKHFSFVCQRQQYQFTEPE